MQASGQAPHRVFDANCQNYIGNIGKNGSDAPIEQDARPSRVVDRIGQQRVAGGADLANQPRVEPAMVGVDRCAAEPGRPSADAQASDTGSAHQQEVGDAGGDRGQRASGLSS